MGKIYILEGPDGTGKSTLAEALQRETKGHLLHLTFNKDWNMQEYYDSIDTVLLHLTQYQDVIIDRWIPSEVVYGSVFRGGTKVDVEGFMNEMAWYKDVKWIYCWNEKAIENHLKNKEVRKEMFDDMTDVVNTFEGYIAASDLPWIKYNFNHVELSSFVKEITQ